MNPPARPLLLWDGECDFCREWIARWRHVTGDRVEYATYQESGHLVPDIPAESLAKAICLIEPDGRRSRGAEAAFRALAFGRGAGLGLWLYRHVPAFAPISEWIYQRVARNRPALHRLTRVVWGPNLVPPGETLTVSIFLRVLGAVYLVAFVSAWVQIIGLVGHDGILPAPGFLAAVKAQVPEGRYWAYPTLAWLDASDGALRAQCAAGTLASLLVVAGLVPVPALIACWGLYLSLSTIGQEFFWFQWDGLILEAGFIAVLLAPWRWRLRGGGDPPPPRLALAMIRWLLFRLMVSSAIVKLASGDRSWLNLTALEYHYETQCLPPWTAWYAHHLPAWFQRFSTLAMFAVEGLVPFLFVAPRRIRFFAAAATAGFQLLIVITGNYGFFNLLTIALCIPLLDDGVWPWRWRRPRAPSPTPSGAGFGWPRWILRPALITLFALSLVPLVEAPGWSSAWMGPLSAAFRVASPLRAVNRYGLFSVMTTRRPEIILEGSNDLVTWREYAFRWKPGDVRGRPGFVAPHMPRLDWQMWFAALGPYQASPWFLAFCARLLQGTPAVLHLMAEDPFAGRPPRFLRATVYEYHFSDAASRRATGAWWRRQRAGLFCPVLTLEGDHLRAVTAEGQ